MRSFIFYSMIVLMIVWSAVFIMEMAYVYFSSTAVAAMAGTDPSLDGFGAFYDTIRDGFWGPVAAARVAVWGLPMMVLAIISAVTQPAPH
jgi:hypothetical protein